MKQPDPYELLGLEPGATTEQVRAAFREKVRQSHPDTAGSEGDGPAVDEIIEAYRRLSESMPRGPQAPSRGDVHPKGRSVRVRHAGTSDGRSNDVTRACTDCRGSGRLRTEMACPECDGRAQITALDGDRGRVIWCRRCSGAGTLLSSQTCSACSGTGHVRT